MSCKCSVAEMSSWPPERNATPATAAGTVSERTSTVAFATSEAEAVSRLSVPGVTMLGLSTIPLKSTPSRASAPKTCRSALRVASKQRSMP